MTNAADIAAAVEAAQRLADRVMDEVGEEQLDSADAVFDDYALISDTLQGRIEPSAEAAEGYTPAYLVDITITDPVTQQRYTVQRALAPGTLTLTGQPLRQVLARMIRFTGLALALHVERQHQ